MRSVEADENYSHGKGLKASYSSLFDLDDTLCNTNTSFRFGLYLFNRKVIPLYKIPILIGCYFLHKVNLISISSLHHYACHFLFKGKSILELRKHVSSFLDLALSHMINPPIFDLVKAAREQGHYTVLLSSSPDFIVKEIAERVGFDEWAATEYNVDHNHTITNVGSLMEGNNKAEFVNLLIREKGILKENIRAYSDSFHDIPFLKSVGVPIAVNPDRKLNKLSATLGWKIIKTG